MKNIERIIYTILFLTLIFFVIALSYGLTKKQSKIIVGPNSPGIASAAIGGMTIEPLSESPKIFLIRNFLSPEECKHLIDIAEPRMARSTVQSEKNVLHKDRTSFTTNLEKSEDNIVKEIEKRASLFNGGFLANMEPLQVVRYHPGQFYKPHYDYFVPGAVGTDVALKNGGQRTVTFFVYLNDLPMDEEGGATNFPKLNLKVRPQAGAALVFWNLFPDGKEDDRLLHGGEPPTKSVKYGLNIWTRQKPYK